MQYNLPTRWHLLSWLLAVTAVGCRSDSGGGDAEEPQPQVEAAPVTASPEADDRQIVLQEFSCGDNCYLTYVEVGFPTNTLQAICRAPECGAWEQAGQLPPAARNRLFTARFGTTRQYDGAGTVMREDFPSIVKLTASDPLAE